MGRTGAETMAGDNIRCDRSAGLWRITIERPDRANALSRQMLGRLVELLGEANADGTLQALILTGSGGRAFSGGADLGEMAAGAAADDGIWDRMAERLVSLPCLTLALINGACIGGAMTLALGCDLRVAVPHATFGYPVLKNGVFPAAGDIERLIALIGPGRAKTILLGGQRISAAEAEAWGLVERIVQPDGLEATATALLATALAASRFHLAALKHRCNQWRA